jgi:hypothetical protein
MFDRLDAKRFLVGRRLFQFSKHFVADHGPLAGALVNAFLFLLAFGVRRFLERIEQQTHSVLQRR